MLKARADNSFRKKHSLFSLTKKGGRRMPKNETPLISLENLRNDIQSFVEKVADEAIQQSETYSQAILLVSKNTSFSEHSLAMTKAIQDEITKRALNSHV
nr:MAG: hypothetical protein [Bacteriophage sp.]